MKAFVTGGSGFIGSHLVEELVKSGYKVKCLVRKTSNINLLKKLGVELVFGDLSNKESLKKSLEGTDIVYHFAAALDATTKDKRIFYDVNVTGTKNLIEASIKAGIKKFIHCSSTGVYGDIHNEIKVNEDYLCKPDSDYTRSKYIGEKEVKSYIGKSKMRIVIIRPPAAVYGERDFSAMYELFKAIENKRFIIMGKGQNIIHVTYVKNLIDGIILASAKKIAEGKIYNLADEKQTTIKELTNEMARALGTKIPKIRLPLLLAKFIGLSFDIISKPFGISMPLSLKRVGYLTKSRSFDISKSIEELDYKQNVNLSEGMKRTVDWYKKNTYLKNIDEIEKEICAKTQDEGFGAVYERIVLERLLKKLQKKYGFNTVLELGCHITKGFDNLALLNCDVVVASDNIQELKEKWEKFDTKLKLAKIGDEGKYDLVWNFATVQLDPDIINQMKENSKRYILFLTPNIWNYGTPFHMIYHILSRTKCNHAERGRIILRRRSGLRKIAKQHSLRILEDGYVDMPFWPDTAFSIREAKQNILGIKLKPVEMEFKNPDKVLNKIKKMMFIENSKFLGPLKHFFAHHTYVFCELK